MRKYKNLPHEYKVGKFMKGTLPSGIVAKKPETEWKKKGTQKQEHTLLGVPRERGTNREKHEGNPYAKYFESPRKEGDTHG
jgi:hypothetical protein